MTVSGWRRRSRMGSSRFGRAWPGCWLGCCRSCKSALAGPPSVLRRLPRHEGGDPIRHRRDVRSGQPRLATRPRDLRPSSAGVFVLRNVFEVPYEEIAAATGKVTRRRLPDRLPRVANRFWDGTPCLSPSRTPDRCGSLRPSTPPCSQATAILGGGGVLWCVGGGTDGDIVSPEV